MTDRQCFQPNETHVHLGEKCWKRKRRQAVEKWKKLKQSIMRVVLTHHKVRRYHYTTSSIRQCTNATQFQGNTATAAFRKWYKKSGSNKWGDQRAILVTVSQTTPTTRKQKEQTPPLRSNCTHIRNITELPPTCYKTLRSQQAKG